MSRDSEIAQPLANELLCPSFVCDLGLFGALPTLRFANNRLGIEVWFSIEGGFQLSPSPDLPIGLTSRQRDLLLLESTYGLEVQTVECCSDSHLEILFTNGTTLTTNNSLDVEEPWTLREEGGNALLVASRAGGFAVWQRLGTADPINPMPDV
jgi:hypothetical protein